MSVIETANNGGPLPLDGIELLLNAASLARDFQDINACFWVETQELVEGCIEDYEVPPYDVDLRDTVAWVSALESLLAAPGTPRADELRSVLNQLRMQGRPYAPEPFVYSHSDISLDA